MNVNPSIRILSVLENESSIVNDHTRRVIGCHHLIQDGNLRDLPAEYSNIPQTIRSMINKLIKMNIVLSVILVIQVTAGANKTQRKGNLEL
jgi:hypothetical protein